MDIYSPYAERYDELSTDYVKTLENGFRQKLLARFVPSGSDVLDLGCGTAATHALLNAPQSYIGIDVSPAMLAVAQRKVPSGIMVQHDLSNGLPNVGKFNAIVSMYGSLSHLTQAQFSRLTGDIYRALPSGGSVVLDVMNKNSLERLASGKWSSKTYRVSFLSSGTETPMEFYTPGAITEMLESAGFKVKHVTSATVLPARGLPLIRPLCNRFRLLGRAVYGIESAIKTITDVTGPKLGRALIITATKP
jgi:SAM-dependent methyltransferase